MFFIIRRKLFLKVFDDSVSYFYLPNLQSFKTGEGSFWKTTSLSLSSNSKIINFSVYLPNLQSFETGNESFFEITSLSLSSNSKIINFSIYIFLIYNHS